MKIGVDARFAVKKPCRGIGTYSINLLNELILIAKNVNFILYIDEPDKEGLLPSGPNVSVKSLWPRSYPLWEQLALPLAVLRDDLDLLHTLGNTAPLWVPSRTRLVLTLHDVMFLQEHEFVPKPTTTYQRAGRMYRSAVVPFNANRADAIITISNFSRNDILSLIPNLDPEKIAVLHEACDPIFSDTSVIPRILEDRPYLLCLGAEDPRKNTERIVHGYLDAIERYNLDVDLVVVGYPNWIGSSADRMVKNADAANRVHFMPFIPLKDLVSLYQHSIALLYLSLYEGFGIPILEAFSCGCPVIASNSTSIPEVGGDAALYIDPTDISSIAGSIARLCSDTAFRSELRERGLVRAEKFNWKSTAIQTFEIYRNIVSDSNNINK